MQLKKLPNLSHKVRGFHPGDDDKLQAVIKKNLQKAHNTHSVAGDAEKAARLKKHLDALEEHERLEKEHDPNDTIPDDPGMG